jgi:hypothetical protein
VKQNSNSVFAVQIVGHLLVQIGKCNSLRKFVVNINAEYVLWVKNGKDGDEKKLYELCQRNKKPKSVIETRDKSKE